MKYVLRSAVVISWAAAALAGPAAAGDRCHHEACGSACRIYVIDSHRHIPEIQYREYKIKVPKKKCETRLVEEKSVVLKPSYKTIIEPGKATIEVPHCKLETCFVPHREFRPETTYKTVTVDAGRTECVGERSGFCGKLVWREAWVPNYIEQCVPCTELVCREVIVPETKVECRNTPLLIEFPLEKSVVHFNTEELVRHVPVTTETYVEEEVVIRVPFATTRCVACRQVFKTEDQAPELIKTCDTVCKLP